VGLSPIYACGRAAMQGLKILQTSETFFEHGSQPSGVLSAPAAISNDVADRIQKHWDDNFGGKRNIGKVAVLGDGLKYEQMTMTAVDAQLIDQLKWGDERVCSTFHVPPYMVGVGPPPNYNNIEALDQNYYSGCLHKLIEAVESCLDQGLGLEKAEINYQTNLNVKDLLKMDTPTKVKTYIESVRGVLTTNEAREELGYDEVKGGDAVLSQQQNYDIAALAKREAKEDPFAKAETTPKTPKKPAQDAGDSGQPTPPPEPKMITDQRPQLSVEERSAAYQKGFNDCAAA